MEKELLYRYFNHEVTADERSQVRQWVEESPENRQSYLRERALFDATTLLAEEPLAQPGRFRRILWRASKVAAVAVVTLLMSYLAQTLFFEPVYPMQELTVPAGQQLNLTLADGTSIWLNSKTTLRYPACFSGDERRVEIDGEAYCSVVHNANMPFHVVTPHGEVRVLGTTFNVESYSTDSIFRTSLIEGSVEMIAGGRSMILSPGQIGSVDVNGHSRIAAIDDYDEFRWTEGIISLKNDSFEEIMRKFEKYYGVRISVEDKKFDGIAYSGKFYQVDGVRYALRVLQRDIDFEFETEEENHIIHIK